jgi:hypothetical protein
MVSDPVFGAFNLIRSPAEFCSSPDRLRLFYVTRMALHAPAAWHRIQVGIRP